jgi:hypothetical protein
MLGKKARKDVSLHKSSVRVGVKQVKVFQRQSEEAFHFEFQMYLKRVESTPWMVDEMSLCTKKSSKFECSEVFRMIPVLFLPRIPV